MPGFPVGRDRPAIGRPEKMVDHIRHPGICCNNITGDLLLRLTDHFKIPFHIEAECIKSKGCRHRIPQKNIFIVHRDRRKILQDGMQFRRNDILNIAGGGTENKVSVFISKTAEPEGTAQGAAFTGKSSVERSTPLVFLQGKDLLPGMEKKFPGANQQFPVEGSKTVTVGMRTVKIHLQLITAPGTDRYSGNILPGIQRKSVGNHPALYRNHGRRFCSKMCQRSGRIFLPVKKPELIRDIVFFKIFIRIQ